MATAARWEALRRGLAVEPARWPIPARDVIELLAAYDLAVAQVARLESELAGVGEHEWSMVSSLDLDLDLDLSTPESIWAHIKERHPPRAVTWGTVVPVLRALQCSLMDIEELEGRRRPAALRFGHPTLVQRADQARERAGAAHPSAGWSEGLKRRAELDNDWGLGPI